MYMSLGFGRSCGWPMRVSVWKRRAGSGSCSPRATHKTKRRRDRLDMGDEAQAARERLIRLGGKQLANELAAIYLEEMPRRMARARTALRERDPATLASESHGMKSSSAQLGAADLATACEAVEDAAEQGDVTAAVA